MDCLQFALSTLIGAKEDNPDPVGEAEEEARGLLNFTARQTLRPLALEPIGFACVCVGVCVCVCVCL